MAKRKNNQKKTVLAIFVEGDTEVEFYKKMISSIQSKADRANCIIQLKNVKGIGNYQTKVCRMFDKSIKRKYPNDKYNYVVALCYDTDVFDFDKKPPVNWDSVIKELKTKGANSVELIRAEKSIEDWFLYDSEGLKRFLRLPIKINISSYKGQQGLTQLFRKANKSYIKGIQCKGLVDALDMDKIFPHICKEIHVLCNTIGVNCSDFNERCKL